MIKVYPSQLTWTEGRANVAGYSSNCWRYILLAQGVRTEIHPVYKAIGALHEEIHEKELIAAGTKHERELPFKFDVGNYTVSGRVDFDLGDRIDECKASATKAKVTNAPSDTHLYQLSLYLGHFGYDHGHLIYGYVQQRKDGTLERTETNTLLVSVKDDGKIFVERRETGYNIDQVLHPVVGLGQVLETGMIPERPIASGWSSPCRTCPVADQCDKYDRGDISSDDLKQSSKALIRDHKQAEPKLTKVRVNGKIQ